MSFTYTHYIELLFFDLIAFSDQIFFAVCIMYIVHDIVYYARHVYTVHIHTHIPIRIPRVDVKERVPLIYTY